MDVAKVSRMLLLAVGLMLSLTLQTTKAATTSSMDITDTTVAEETDTDLGSDNMDSTVPPTGETSAQPSSSTMMTSTTESGMLFAIEPVYIALIGMGGMILLMLIVILIIMCRYVRPNNSK